MKYVFCNETKATQHGFAMTEHRLKGSRMLLNEKEVMNCPSLSGTLNERAVALDGRAFTDRETDVKLNNGDWSNE
jgi:hypothetical protein